MLAYFGYEDNKFQSNTMGATTDAGTAHLSGDPEFIPVFNRVRVALSIIFCVVFCRLLFVLFLLTITFSVL